MGGGGGRFYFYSSISITIRVITKSDDREAGVRFVNHDGSVRKLGGKKYKLFFRGKLLAIIFLLLKKELVESKCRSV